MIPDWQLPPGVDRGLWDYLHAGDMVAGYDVAMRASPLAAADVAFCERAFSTPGKLLDLGCGTGRLCLHFAAKGYECVGVDLSEEMLERAKDNLQLLEDPARYRVRLVSANIADSTLLSGETFDYAACLFSTLGMIRGASHRATVIGNAFRLLKPGGRFVLHVHNRFFRGLGWKRVLGERARTLLGRPDAGDISMPQAYAGAPLTLHHFTRREVKGMLEGAGFAVWEVLAVGDDGRPAKGSRVYGWLMVAERVS
jgi:SAM-dependent methyltransferase